jgi:hypothetical protein
MDWLRTLQYFGANGAVWPPARWRRGAHGLRNRGVRKIGELAAAVGRGLFAGAAGTAAMTVSSTVEMKLRGRSPSTAPARAAAKVLGVEPVGEREQKRFATLVHWGYGTSWGAVRGAIAFAGLDGVRAAATFYAIVWGTELALLPSLDIGVPPAWKWGAEEVAIDALHHVVFATATSAAYDALSG